MSIHVHILYIKVTMFVRLFVCVGSAWKILPVIAPSLWNVLGGGGRDSPVKHGAGGGQHGQGRGGRGGGEGPGGGGQHGRGRGTGGEGSGRGGLNRCIVHRVHTSNILKQ